MNHYQDPRWDSLRAYKEAFDADHRQKVASIALASLRARQRLGDVALLVDILSETGPTLPDAEPRSTTMTINSDDKNSRKSNHFERSGRVWLRGFRDNYAPQARLLRIKEPDSSREYYRLTAYDEAGNPAWAIAERDENGNATYIWRGDLSPVDPDTAFATTRVAALGHGCLRVIHPAGFGDTTTEAAAREAHIEKVAEALTAPMVMSVS